MSAMRVRQASKPGECQAIEAEFVFGPQRCWRSATVEVEDCGEWFHTCDEHLAGVEVGA